MTNKPNLRRANLVLNDFAVKVYADNGGFCLRENKANVRGRDCLSGCREAGLPGLAPLPECSGSRE